MTRRRDLRTHLRDGLPAAGREQGSTLVFTLGLLLGLLALTIAGLSAAGSGLRVSSNYQTGLQALHAAESGVGHSQKVLTDMGVQSFALDVLPVWDQVFGSSSRSMPGYGSISYSVAAAADTTDPATYMFLTASGQAPNESQRTIRARVRRQGAFSPGAIYLPNDSVDTTFNGNNFMVDGFDHLIGGGLNPNGADVPGITTHSGDAAQQVRQSLGSGQADNVIGTGGMPSVRMSGGPTVGRINDTVVPNMLRQPGVVTDPVLNGNDVFGTASRPQITHFTGSVNVTGNLSGAGILIVDHGLTISGSSTFTGLIIVRGTTQITAVQGNTTILGALWTTDLQLTVAGSASVTYSSNAMKLANDIGAGNLVPQHVRVVSWMEQ